MPRLRLPPIGAEEPIPPRQGKPEVGVRLRRISGVMHTMHVWRDEDRSEQAIDRSGQPQVGVAEERAGIEQDLEQNDRRHRWPENRNRPRLEPHGEQHLDRVEAQPGGHIELGVRVVHPVHPPQQRHRVKQPVLEVNCEIQHDHRDHDIQPDRQRHNGSKKTPATRMDERRNPHGGDRRHGAEHDRVDRDQPQVAAPPRTERDRTTSAGRQPLGDHQQRETCDEGREPNQCLVTRGLHGEPP